MSDEQAYNVTIVWTGNRGDGTAAYEAYDRNHRIEAAGRPPIAGSADPDFRGDPDKYTPEHLLVAATSACHMMWYLHLAASAGVVVTAYTDAPVGIMTGHAAGQGRFTEIVLRPQVTIADAARAHEAEALHEKAHRHCSIARSLACPVRHEAHVAVAG